MRKILTAFFVSLGVIFFIILFGLGYVYFSDAFGVRSLLSGASTSNKTTESVDKNPLLNATQEKTLEAIGVDPTKLPTAITPEMLACFNIELGTTRTEEIKNGSTPTATDYLKAKSCLSL